MKRSIRLFFVLSLATIAPLTIAAQEQQRTWGTKGQGEAGAAKSHPASTVAPRQRTWGTKGANAPNTQPTVHHTDWRATHRDNDRDADDRPPGWAHGRKVGWHGNDVPPGQVKRDAYERHEREHRRHHHRREWERDHHRFRHDRDHRR
jgi:hypothetical protein